MIQHNIKDLLEGVNYELKGDDQAIVKGLALDSRKVNEGFLFAALLGSAIDGHEFIQNAIDRGARVVLCESNPSVMSDSVTYVQVEDSRVVLGSIANRFYNQSSSKLKCVGITGTNGKTSVATLLYGLFKELGFKVGLISTVEILVNEKKWSAELTTPDVISLHRLFMEMVEAECSHVFMEVSSHAVAQDRIAGVDFTGGVFTNLTHDHLDYHGDFSSYLKAKQRFFSELKPEAFSLINWDDKNGEVMVQNSQTSVFKYSLRRLTDFKSKLLDEEIMGMQLDIDGYKFFTRLAGRFNASNLTAVYGTAVLLEDFDRGELIEKISGLSGAKGRMEVVSYVPRVLVDYAHTPDAILNVLKTLRLTVRTGRLITVIGCGGDRDRAKRSVMGRIAHEHSNIVIFTSDNPRTEDPNRIIEEMMKGVERQNDKTVLEIVDRTSAIKTALSLSTKEDTVLIAGKGHEEYQEINGIKHFFSDQQIVKDILSKDI